MSSTGKKKGRGFISFILISLAFTVAAIGSVLVALGAVVILPVALNDLGLHNVTDLILLCALAYFAPARVVRTCRALSLRAKPA